MPAPGHRRREPVRLRDGPHRHVAAVAPAEDAEAVRVDRRDAQHLVDPREHVAQVAAAEVLDVGAREGLAEPVAAARVGKEHEVALRRQGAVPPRGPADRLVGGRTAVDGHDHRVASGRIEVHRDTAASPAPPCRRSASGGSSGLAPEGRHPGVDVGDRLPLPDRAGRDLRRLAKGREDRGGGRARGGHRERVERLGARSRARSPFR